MSAIGEGSRDHYQYASDGYRYVSGAGKLERGAGKEGVDSPERASHDFESAEALESRGIERKKNPDLSDVFRPKTLLFEGGGMKGIGYIGVLEVLEIKNIMDGVQSVAGVSAGSIIATLIACGYNSNEIKEIFQEIIEIPGILSKTKLLQDISPLRDVIENKIYLKTRKRNCTFEDFRKLREREPKKFKNLHIYAVDKTRRITDEEKIQKFSTDEPNARKDKVIIASAVSASCAFPGKFGSVTLQIKDKEGLVKEDESLGVFEDGGTAINDPFEDFSPKTTLCFLLEAPKKDKKKSEPTKKAPVGPFLGVVDSIYTYMKGDSIRIARARSKYKIVLINTRGISTFDSLTEPQIRSLIASGRLATERYIEQEGVHEDETRIERMQRTWESSLPFMVPSDVLYKFNHSMNNYVTLGVASIASGLSIYFMKDINFATMLGGLFASLSLQKMLEKVVKPESFFDKKNKTEFWPDWFYNSEGSLSEAKLRLNYHQISEEKIDYFVDYLVYNHLLYEKFSPDFSDHTLQYTLVEPKISPFLKKTLKKPKITKEDEREWEQLKAELQKRILFWKNLE